MLIDTPVQDAAKACDEAFALFEDLINDRKVAISIWRRAECLGIELISPEEIHSRLGAWPGSASRVRSWSAATIMNRKANKRTQSGESADWPGVVLQRLLAFNILLVHGRYGESKPLDYWHRVRLGGPIVRGSVLTHLLIAPPEAYKAQFSLASGKVDLLHVVGITERERDYAKSNGDAALLELLRSHRAFPTTDPNRTCLTS